MALYRLEEDLPPLTSPVLIAAFDGWVDAAGAASGAIDHLAAGCRTIARFDGDELFDYRSRRPVLDVVDGALHSLAWPDLTIRHAAIGGRDLLLFCGAEPDLRWQALGDEVVELARRLQVAEWISLGAVPAAVAHTRPVPVMATASRDGLLRDDEPRGPVGLLRVPAAAISAIEMAITAGGVPAVGFFAPVPPYVASGYVAASVALLERLGSHLDVELPLSELVAAAAEERRRFDVAMANDQESHDMVRRLETMAGEDPDGPERLPTGDELASEIERFLRDRGEDGPTGPSFS